MVLSKESYDWLIPQFACVIVLKTGDYIVFEGGQKLHEDKFAQKLY